MDLPGGFASGDPKQVNVGAVEPHLSCVGRV